MGYFMDLKAIRDETPKWDVDCLALRQYWIRSNAHPRCNHGYWNEDDTFRRQDSKNNYNSYSL